MRGFLVLFLLGEKLARNMHMDGVAAPSALAWLERWNKLVEDGSHASPGNSDITSSLLTYQITALRELIRDAAADDDE